MSVKPEFNIGISFNVKDEVWLLALPNDEGFCLEDPCTVGLKYV